MAKTDNVKAIRDTEIEALFQEVVTALEAEDWNRAILLSDEILEKDPNNVKGYLYKLLANNKCKSNEELKGIDKPFDDDPLYKKIFELGSIELKDELEAAILFIKARMAEKAELEAKAKIYEFAAKNQDLDTIKSLKLAESKFMSISGWSDADERAEVCRNRIKELVEKAEAEKAAKKERVKLGVASFIDSLAGRKMFKVKNGVLSINEKYKGDLPAELIIPEEYYGEKVTAIGDDAFLGCTRLISVTIPNGVTSIGKGAFFGCSGLTSITIPDSVTSIGNRAFACCKRLTSITIPNNIISISDSAFYECSELTNITIPKKVISIGDYVFSGCKMLQSVAFADTAAWYCTVSPGYIEGTKIDVTDASTNAKYFTETYPSHCWYKK